MDKYAIQKLFDGHYQIIDKRGESLYEGSISNCYAWMRIMEMNLIEE